MVTRSRSWKGISYVSSFWQRLLGSILFALAVLVLIYWRTILSSQIDPPGMLVGWLAGTLIAYRAWPALEYAPWHRRKNSER